MGVGGGDLQMGLPGRADTWEVALEVSKGHSREGPERLWDPEQRG